MQINSALRAVRARIGSALARFPFVSVGIVASIVIAIAVSVPWGISAQGDPGRNCSTHTLRGDYGLVGTGVRGLGPGASESFATVSMVTYDGQGRFTAVGVSHGQTTGVRAGLPVSGTYYVNPDCTGGQTTNIQGAPPIEDNFVIVDNGHEVRTVVIAPLTTLGTANLRKK